MWTKITYQHVWDSRCHRLFGEDCMPHKKFCVMQKIGWIIFYLYRELISDSKLTQNGTLECLANENVENENQSSKFLLVYVLHDIILSNHAIVGKNLLYHLLLNVSIFHLSILTTGGSGSKIAYIFMLLIMRDIRCSENR